MEDNYLTGEETDILQELMNIAFGQSAADLGDVIETHVVLSVPFIKIMKVSELPEYIKDYVKEFQSISIVEQQFWGRFKGDALLVFSAGAGKKMVSLLQHEENKEYEVEPIDVLERETLMEVGNILIGACIGKIAELLKDVVTYTPPMIIVGKHYEEVISENHIDPEKTAIVLKTDFHFDKEDVSGFLFLVTSSETIKWLKEALRIFIKQYE